jgi:hypothetical protein
MRRSFFLLIAILIPFSVSAATFRIDVTGSLEGAYAGLFASMGGGPSGYLPIHDPTNVAHSPELYDQTGGGSAVVQADTGSIGVSNCSGLLTALCSGLSFNIIGNDLHFAGFSAAGVLRLNPLPVGGSVGTFYTVLDHGSYFASKLGFFDYTGNLHNPVGESFAVSANVTGQTLFVSGPAAGSQKYNLTSFQVTSVPLPAAGWGLLTCLGGLVLLRRFRKQRQA